MVSRLPACSADYPPTHPPHPAPARPAPAQYLSLEFCHTQCSQVVVGGVAGRQRCVLPSHCGLTCNGSHPALNVGMASPSLPLPPGRPAAGLRSTCDPQCDAPSLPSDLAACARESFRRTGTTFTMGRCDKGASKPLALALRAGHPPTPSLLFLLRSQMSLGQVLACACAPMTPRRPTPLPLPTVSPGMSSIPDDTTSRDTPCWGCCCSSWRCWPPRGPCASLPPPSPPTPPWLCSKPR